MKIKIPPVIGIWGISSFSPNRQNFLHYGYGDGYGGVRCQAYVYLFSRLDFHRMVIIINTSEATAGGFQRLQVVVVADGRGDAEEGQKIDGFAEGHAKGLAEGRDRGVSFPVGEKHLELLAIGHKFRRHSG